MLSLLGLLSFHPEWKQIETSEADTGVYPMWGPGRRQEGGQGEESLLEELWFLVTVCVFGKGQRDRVAYVP